MSNSLSRQAQKTHLLRQIRSQRAEFLQLGEAWAGKMRPVDSVFHTLYRLRAPLVTGGVLLLLKRLKWSRRNPERVLMYARRAAGVWGAVRFTRKFFGPGN